MRTWIFAGMCDKSDLLMYLCKILANGGSKVLLADAAHHAKYTHYISRVDASLNLAEFGGFDIATRFANYDSLLEYIEKQEGASYDYMILDVEQPEYLRPEHWHGADARIWVSGFELMGLIQGAEWLKRIAEEAFGDSPPSFHRIYMNVIEDLTDDSYIESYLDHSGVHWLDEPIRMPWDELAYALKVENEHAGRLRLKPLSRHYKRSLMELIRRLTELESRHIRRALRLAERRHA
ncbi:hypothetical protein [Paenibacillus campinasensis]|uniref:Uncharacterized protein n=1 Tax=Paenibacillus campinasensis TaxID=66347 RepID=A0A268F1Y5_9BACL|nr:hypothetical protein [Paenibacillus campinasensis]PAD79353.1 hypothetical protein CHH67_03855 [Paenibacillus campinasensis]